MGIGALMNARGPMELIMISIGLQRGIIGPALFSILVVVAIVTTLMASPLFELVYGKKARGRDELGSLADAQVDLSPAKRAAVYSARVERRTVKSNGMVTPAGRSASPALARINRRAASAAIAATG